MRVYFIASIYGKEDYMDNYKAIVSKLEKMGHIVIADHVLNSDISDIVEQDDESRVTYYKKMLKWLSASDLIVADITSPSSSVGHEVTMALEKEKPVLALSYKGVAPNIFKGMREDKFFLLEYNDLEDDLRRKLSKGIRNAQKSIDIRFNFFIPPKISSYLDWVSKEKRVPRSVYLRRLIEEDMAKDTEYKENS